MNKVFLQLVVAIFLAFFSSVSAEEQEFSVEFRSSAFFHSSKRFRELYGNVGSSYQLEASAPICNCLDGWVNFDWFSKNKRSGCASKVSIANISFGIKFPYQLCEQVTAYIGIGPSLSRIWLKNKSHCCHENVSKLAIGGVLKTGIYYFINQCIFIDLFVDYLYQPINFEKTVDIGGLKTGAGLGIQF